MTEINFYVSKNEGLKHRFAVAYRLLNIALQRKFHVHIHTDSELTSKQLNDYLWTNETSSFIPHDIILNSDPKMSSDEKTKLPKSKVVTKESEDNGIVQVIISHEIEPYTDCDYLINLSNNRPPFFSRFTKVAEILDNNQEIIATGRKRYSFYRDRGYTLGYYEL